MRKVKEAQGGLKLTGTRQLLFCSDDIHLMVENISTVKKNTEAVLFSVKEAGLGVRGVARSGAVG
jgi:hypothetical protein